MSSNVAIRPFDLLTALDQKSRESSGGMPVYEQAGSSWTGVLVTLGTDQLMFSMRVVREIIIPPPVTRVPGVQAWLTGIANLRGTLFPVIDLEQLLGLESGVDNLQQRRLLVVERQGFLLGVLVSSVHGMKNYMNADQVENHPTLSESLGAYIRKSFQSVDEHFSVLDIDLLMQDPKIHQVSIRMAI